MYPIAGIRAFSGMHHFDDTPERAHREYLRSHVDQAASNPRMQTLLQRWNVRYLLVSEKIYPARASDLNSSDRQQAAQARWESIRRTRALVMSSGAPTPSTTANSPLSSKMASSGSVCSL